MTECLDAYGGLVWSIARRLCGDAAEAEDAVQEAFLSIWKSAEKFDAARSSEKTFVAMIARRRIIDRRRSAQRRLDVQPLADPVPTESRIEADLETQEEAVRARRMMTELKDDERRVLELAVDHGLSQSEIATRTGMPLGTVKTHARRGMIRLRELLADGPVSRGTIV